MKTALLSLGLYFLSAPLYAADPPVFEDIQEIVQSTCVRCHQGSFATKEHWVEHRDNIKNVINARFMPPFKPFWKNSEDGKKVLNWLEFGKEITEGNEETL